MLDTAWKPIVTCFTRAYAPPSPCTIARTNAGSDGRPETPTVRPASERGRGTSPRAMSAASGFCTSAAMPTTSTPRSRAIARSCTSRIPTSTRPDVSSASEFGAEPGSRMRRRTPWRRSRPSRTSAKIGACTPFGVKSSASVAGAAGRAVVVAVPVAVEASSPPPHAAIARAAAATTAASREVDRSTARSMARPRLRHGVRQPFGRIAGVQHLEFARVPARRGASRGTIVVILGGPGQPALPFARDIAADALFADHDLLLVDPRGTGLSDPTGCVVRALPGSARGAREAAACAARLGARRATLTSEEDARDLEDVRVALGIPSLTVLGISSGTRVAAEYVRRFPASTDHAVLDSPVAFDGVDAIGQLPSLSFPRVLKEVCWPPGCVGISGPADPRRTVGRLVARLERRALRTSVVDTSGAPHRFGVSTDLLYVLLRASDAAPVLRADLPAAIRSALNGDGAYLTRLV